MAKKFPQKDSAAIVCKFAVFPVPFIPIGCFAGVATYVHALFDYRHRYSMCLTKDLRSADRFYLFCFFIYQVFSFGLRVLNIGCLKPITVSQLLSVWKQKQNNRVRLEALVFYN